MDEKIITHTINLLDAANRCEHCIDNRFHVNEIRDDEGDEGTQAANINELFDYALELLWTLVTKNGWDQTKLPDISEGFSYVSKK